jgi:hypothetical protein
MSGPKLEIVGDCAGCEHLRTRSIPVPYGSVDFATIRHFCTYGIDVSESVNGAVLPCATRTPASCPLLPAARKAFLKKACEASLALSEVSQEVRRK